MSGPNGVDVAQFKRKAPPETCPFCNGEAQPMSLDPPGQPRIFGVQCKACGVLSAPGANEEEALANWNRRAAASPASLATPETTPETAAIAAQLVDIARMLYSGQIPGAVASVVLLVVPSGSALAPPSIAMHLQALDQRQAAQLCGGAAQQLAAQAVAMASPSGILIPGR